MRALQSIPLSDILFLDIETVPLQKDFEHLSVTEQSLWDEKTLWQRKEQTPSAYYMERAGILAEFGKIVCISVGIFTIETTAVRLKSFYGTDEKKILTDFAQLLQQYYHKPNHRLCAHNGKEFDFPYLARRMLIQGVPLPTMLDISGKKPWEVKHLDTMELWKFGDYKNFTSLKLLAHVLGIPSPKDDIDGSQVATLYYENLDNSTLHKASLDRIVTYCQKDVFTVCQVFFKLSHGKLLDSKSMLVI